MVDVCFRLVVSRSDAATLSRNLCVIELGHKGPHPTVGSVRFGGQSAGPGDVAVAGGIEGVAAFGEHPAATGKGFAQRKIVRSDVFVAAREAFLAGRLRTFLKESAKVQPMRMDFSASAITCFFIA